MGCNTRNKTKKRIEGSMKPGRSKVVQKGSPKGVPSNTQLDTLGHANQAHGGPIAPSAQETCSESGAKSLTAPAVCPRVRSVDPVGRTCSPRNWRPWDSTLSRPTPWRHDREPCAPQTASPFLVDALVQAAAPAGQAFRMGRPRGAHPGRRAHFVLPAAESSALRPPSPTRVANTKSWFRPRC